MNNEREIKFRARQMGKNTELVKDYIKYINRRLANYHYVTGFAEERGLREAMKRNNELGYYDLMLKIVDMAKRFHLALDQKDREIGSSIIEWRQLVNLFTKIQNFLTKNKYE